MNKKQKVIFICEIVVIAILIAVLIFVKSVYGEYYDDSVKIVDNVDFSTLQESDTVNIVKVEQKEAAIYNIILSGLDTRSYNENSRSDSTILVSYNTETQTVKMISLMRDSWVYIPVKNTWDRINASSVYGGVGLLINTVNNDFALDVQDFVQVKFSDFKTIIDMIGGLDVELTDAEIRYINGKLHTDDRDYKNDIKEPAGIIHLNGTQLLWHCRNRTIGNADFGRTDRQRQVLSLLIDKAVNMSKSEVTSLILKCGDYINTNMELGTITKMAISALGNDITIESYRLPFEGTYNYANKYGASVISIDIQENARQLHKILGYDDYETLEIDLPPEPIYKAKTTVETEKDENEEKTESEPELVETEEVIEPIEEEPTEEIDNSQSTEIVDEPEINDEQEIEQADIVIDSAD